MRQYNIMLELARDKSSSLYNADGSHHRGASHHRHFWNGFEYGRKYPHLVLDTDQICYCVFRAGEDFKIEEPTA